MGRLVSLFVAAALLGLGVFWWLSAPSSQLLESAQISDALTHKPDLENGERVFWASGCASCHAEKGAKEAQKLLLGGGHRLHTPFGTFVTPNISSDTDTGIGKWTITDFAKAMLDGVSPDGKHYYPSFPYNSYNNMTASDLVDLFEYLKALPAVSRQNEEHDLALPFQWRRPLGIWKLMFVDQGSPTNIDEDDEAHLRGRYLAEVLGHCGECHTPRSFLGGLKTGAWLAGGAAPEGEGRIPNITPHSDGIGSWSRSDIVYYLESGFTPDFDSVGGTMTSVQQNMAKLPKEDLEAIAAYLKAIPSVPSN